MDSVVKGIGALTATDAGDAIVAPIGAALKSTADGYLQSFPLTGSGGNTAAASDVCGVIKSGLPTFTGC
jgi:hypothetical protein